MSAKLAATFMRVPASAPTATTDTSRSVAAFCAAALVFVFKGKPTFGKSGKGYSWGLTGLLLGWSGLLP